MQRVIFLGGGGHAVVVADALRASRRELLGWVGPAPASNGDDAAVRLAYLGTEAALERLITAGIGLILAFVGQPGSPVRRECWQRWCRDEVPWTTVIHPQAVVSDQAKIGVGVYIGPGAIVNAGAVIADHVVINSGVIIEHHASIGQGAHVAPRAVIGGGARVGTWATIGMGALVRDHRRVGDRAIVAMGAVVVDDIADDLTVFGLPARARP